MLPEKRTKINTVEGIDDALSGALLYILGRYLLGRALGLGAADVLQQLDPVEGGKLAQ